MNVAEGMIYAVAGAVVLFSLGELAGRWLRLSCKRAELRRTLRHARGAALAMRDDIKALSPPGMEAPVIFADEAIRWFDAEIAGDHVAAYDLEVGMARCREVVEHETFVRTVAHRN